MIGRPEIQRIVVINDLARPQGGASLLALQSVRDFTARGRHVTMISGDHGRVERWRLEQRIERTRQRRPDLLTDSGTHPGSDPQP